MNEQFRDAEIQDLQPGTAIWFEGRSFLDTSIKHPYDGNGPLTGPYLVTAVNVQPFNLTSVRMVDPKSGEERTMLYSWLKVPKETTNES